MYDVSIIIPFYKGNEYLPKLFESINENIKCLVNKKVEVVLVNDSPEINICINRDYNFDLHIVFNKDNMGIHKSRVNGIKYAKGEFILMLDQDDILTPISLKSHLETIKNNDISIGNGYDENPISKGNIYHSKKHQDCVLDLNYYFYVNNMIVSPGQCLIRKDAIPNEWLTSIIENNGSDDLLLWIMMFNKKVKMTVNYESVYIHTFHDNNVSADFDKMKKSSLEVLKLLKDLKMISLEEENIFDRRLKMREMYEGKGKINKILAMLKYRDIAKVLVSLKRK